ncbi:MAG TPA: zf-HC2 domain-containing protein [bacterium]|nr:zf-HC2 domain-containing protein [bacterium]
MNHTHVADHLSAYLDGALPASDLEQVQAHLEVCGTCGRAYEELRTLRSLLRALPDPVAPSGLEDRIHWRLAREEAAFRPSPWRAVWAAVTRPAVTRPLRVALAGATILVIIGLPMGWVSGLFAPRGTLFDPDAYVRNYLMTSSDRLTDDVTRTVIAHTALPESTVQR